MYTYFLFWTEKNAPELGTYHTWDIVVYDRMHRDPVETLRDVTPDCSLAHRMIEAFNRCGLSLVHLKDAVLDMLG